MFSSSFIWNDSNVYIQLGYKGYGWQTLIIVCLLLIWITNMISLLMQISGTNLFLEYGKFKIMLTYAICGLLAVIAAGLQTWNGKLAHDVDDTVLYPRFITTAVCY
ncbi:unnamed protein product [Gongylonema pulchrum]|uniref:Uncharacterized protein n=1 Tax=Gongylonema pulchrum TaxID=637853 RepID=A0A3P7RHW6_9BILA|nr:unnamed protein product [Gongylonema pulchrum]